MLRLLKNNQFVRFSDIDFLFILFFSNQILLYFSIFFHHRFLIGVSNILLPNVILKPKIKVKILFCWPRGNIEYFFKAFEKWLGSYVNIKINEKTNIKRHDDDDLWCIFFFLNSIRNREISVCKSSIEIFSIKKWKHCRT